MDRYKSWSGLNRQLHDMLCDELKGRVRYFLTRYHTVHDAYGRAAIRLDGRELAVFSWVETYRQERDLAARCTTDRDRSYPELATQLKPKWDADGTYSEMDFLDAALQFRRMPIRDALESENCIIKILAILDRRVGKRTLANIRERGAYEREPDWVRQFYRLRLGE